MQEAKPIPDHIINALAVQREEILNKERQHSAMNDQLNELRAREKNATEAIQQSTSSLESVKNQIDRLRQEHENLTDTREKRKSIKKILIAQRSSRTGEDLAELNKMIKDIEESVAMLSDQINELARKIRKQNEQLFEMTAQLVQKEQEKKQLGVKIDELQKEKTVLESVHEKARREFEHEMLKMMFALKLSEV